MPKGALLALCLMLVLLAGCSSQTQPVGPPGKEITLVSKRYNEPKPEIVKILPNSTDDTHQPMFLVVLKGNFSKGGLKAARLDFSILASGAKAWGIRATDPNGKDIWLDNE